MATLLELSQACSAALRDAEDKGAMTAAQFLRVHMPEIFRELTHRKGAKPAAEFEPHPLTPAASTPKS